MCKCRLLTISRNSPRWLILTLYYCVMYHIQQTALFGTIIHNIEDKDTLQIHCDSFGFRMTEVAKSVRKVFRMGTVRYNWPMSAHASQAFSIAHCTNLEDLPSVRYLGPKWPRTEITNNRIGSVSGRKWPGTEVTKDWSGSIPIVWQTDRQTQLK